MPFRFWCRRWPVAPALIAAAASCAGAPVSSARSLHAAPAQDDLGEARPSADGTAATADGGRPSAAPLPGSDAANSPAGATAVPLGDEPSGDDGDEIDDGADEPGPAVKGHRFQHPLDGWSQTQLESALLRDPGSLGSLSIGSTNAGALLNAVQMPQNIAWQLVDPDRAWGTMETVSYLTHCLEKVRDDGGDAPLMFIGHLSARRGGHLSPHVSHQAGRDADVSYYYLPPHVHWYVTANAASLDRTRTWAFIRALVTDTDVELILMDRTVQRLVRQHALERGENKAWVDQLFDGGTGLPPLIRHAKGHASHLHVRFYNPIAQETARRTYDLLVAHRMIAPAVVEVRHKVKPGETLSHLALKYGVSAKSIQQANAMKTTVLREGQRYKVLRRAGVRPVLGPTLVPARRLPPAPTADATPTAAAEAPARARAPTAF